MRKSYWDYPTTTTIADLLGPDVDDGSFPVTWDNKAMQGFRRDGMVLAYTTVGEPGTLVMFDWPAGDSGKVAALLGHRLAVKSQAQLVAMARAWYLAGSVDAQ